MTTIEVGSAVRHEALNRLDLCQMELLNLSDELQGDDESCRQRIDDLSRELRAIAAALDRFSVLPVRRVEPRTVVVTDVLDEAVAALEDRFEMAGVEVVVTGGDMALEVYSDALWTVFLQLFLNSLSSFRQAGYRKGGEIQVHASRAPQTTCQIIYSDDGPGIDLARLGIPRDSPHALVSDRIFSPRVSGSGGMGIGLTIAKGLMEGLGGRITLVAARVGVVFELELPTISTSR